MLMLTKLFNVTYMTIFGYALHGLVANTENDNRNYPNLTPTIHAVVSYLFSFQ